MHMFNSCLNCELRVFGHLRDDIAPLSANSAFRVLDGGHRPMEYACLVFMNFDDQGPKNFPHLFMVTRNCTRRYLKLRDEKDNFVQLSRPDESLGVSYRPRFIFR